MARVGPLIVLIFAVAPSYATAEHGTITGRVTDHTGAPLPGTRVTISPSLTVMPPPRIR